MFYIMGVLILKNSSANHTKVWVLRASFRCYSEKRITPHKCVRKDNGDIQCII